MKEDRKITSPQFLTPFAETFGLSPLLALIVFFSSVLIVLFAIFWFFYSAPPKQITITSGPPGSTLELYAEQYSNFLAAKGVTLKILPSQGSAENLQRLNDRSLRHVNLGFVQASSMDITNGSRLVSLGGISYQPLLIFYRATNTINFLSDFNGKRLAIGPIGSGTRSLALQLLHTNGVSGGTATVLELDATPAANALLAGKVDAVFLMGDSASLQIMKQLLFAPGIQLYNFVQADGYTRKFNYLNKMNLPMGSIDFGKNIPAQDLFLIGPAVEILARPNLHPALSDLLIEAMQQVHGGAKMFQRKGEFPSTIQYDFPISQNAARFYKNGKGFLYGSLPFWLASLVNRILVSFVPLIVILIPLLRSIPALYKWRAQLLINRRYRVLLALERELDLESRAPMTNEQRRELITRLENVEQAVNKMKVPASFASQFYSLRENIGFVRGRLEGGIPAAK